MKKKVLAMFMVLAMALSLVPVTALATGEGPVTELTQEAQVQEQEQEEEQQAEPQEGGDANPVVTNPNDENGSQNDSGDPPASGQIIEVGGESGKTLDDAISEAEENDVINLLSDCELTVGEIKAPITIQGNGYTIDIPEQNTDSGGVELKSEWVLKKTVLYFHNEKIKDGDGKNRSWGLVIEKGGVITLEENSACRFKTNGIYADMDTEINIKEGSKIECDSTEYTAMMSDGHNPLNITGNSLLYVHDSYKGNGVPNGITSFNIKVEDSELRVENCENQGLVNCFLELNNSNATISRNDMGITGYNGTDVLIMKNGSIMTMEDNKEAGIFLWGGDIDIQDGNTLTITGTGKSLKQLDDSSLRYYGALAVYYRWDNYEANVNFADGATVNLIDNDVSAINNDGEIYIGKSTTIMNNGSKTLYGGGIQNRGQITVANGAKLYNNHAKNAGDDIYNTAGEGYNRETYVKDHPEKWEKVVYTGNITFAAVGSNWILDDCNDKINGWYDDGSGYSESPNVLRWAAHTYPSYICEFNEFDQKTGLAEVDYEVALKAAHDVLREDPIQPDNERAHSKSKEATNLVKQSDGTYTSGVTLTLPSVEESPVYDVVFVLDKSTSAELEQEALDMLQQLKEQIAGTETTIKVGVVIFNKEAHVTELKNLTTEYGQIEKAIKEDIESGTNTHAGLLAGKKLLDNDKDVAADHKYMIFVSDGITYMYNETPTAIAWGFYADAEKHFAGPDNYASKYGSNVPPENWSEWLTKVGKQIQGLDSKYEYPYGSEPVAITKSSESKATANSVDKALYLTNETYQSAKTDGYHCYAMTATQSKGKQYLWGPSFMSYLAGGKEVSFEDIHNDIYYLLSEGSTVEDIIGYGTDNRGNAYNFDFVNDISKLTLKVGTETLEAIDLSMDLPYGDVNETARYGFRFSAKPYAAQEYDPENQYDYVLHYYKNGTDGKSDECFVWDINVPVSKFAPVSLTYQVKLTNAQTASGTYGAYDKNGSQNKDSLYTNKSATLYPVDSDRVCGEPEAFPKPTVSYTVSGGGGGGGGGGTIDIPDDDVPTGLDLKNHYGYIIGYPVDYYTGEPTTDQTKKPVRPEGKITRAEVATIYFRMLTEENRAANWNQVSGFSDVKRSSWYNNAISTLTKAGILKGYEDGTFQPNGYITRAEFAAIAIRFFNGVYEGEDLFPDIKDHWARDYINNAADKGLVKGYEDGTFGPDRYITRAEAVTLVNRTLNRHPHQDGLHEDMLVWPDNMDKTKWYYADMQEATNSHEPDKDKTDAQTEYWSKMLPIRDWEALEKEWSNANSAPGEGEVV